MNVAKAEPKIDWEAFKKRLNPKCKNCESTTLAIMLAVANQVSGIVAIF